MSRARRNGPRSSSCDSLLQRNALTPGPTLQVLLLEASPPDTPASGVVVVAAVLAATSGYGVGAKPELFRLLAGLVSGETGECGARNLPTRMASHRQWKLHLWCCDSCQIDARLAWCSAENEPGLGDHQRRRKFVPDAESVGLGFLPRPPEEVPRRCSRVGGAAREAPAGADARIVGSVRFPDVHDLDHVTVHHASLHDWPVRISGEVVARLHTYIVVRLGGCRIEGLTCGRTRGSRVCLSILDEWTSHGVSQPDGCVLTEVELKSAYGAHIAQKSCEVLLRDPRALRLSWVFVAYPAGFEPAAIG